MYYKTVKLEKAHDRSEFECEQAPLTDYLKKVVSQDHRRDLSVCYVIPDDDNKVVGYHTLTSSSILKKDLPEDLQKKLGKTYDNIPVILLGRLARHEKMKGQGYGELLLMDALERSYYASLEVAAMAVIVDPIDVNAVTFYRKYGFVILPGSKRMFLMMKTISDLFPDDEQ